MFKYTIENKKPKKNWPQEAQAQMGRHQKMAENYLQPAKHV